VSHIEWMYHQECYMQCTVEWPAASTQVICRDCDMDR